MNSDVDTVTLYRPSGPREIELVRASGYGCVTRFAVRREFMDRYPQQTVGAIGHTEWWIPAEDLEALNDNIVGTIEIIDEFRA